MREPEDDETDRAPICPEFGDTEDLVRHADAAMYIAKTAGRNRLTMPAPEVGNTLWDSPATRRDTPSSGDNTTLRTRVGNTVA